ncbi:MAG TPA: flavin reductase [Baekduia sp.]|nr:flavin reductase [Baekduia sp.]
MSIKDAEHDLEQLTSEEFRDVIGRFASGVTVITAANGDKPLGTTASAFTSLSLEPPMVLVCMNKSSETGRAIQAGKRFAVNILGEGHPDLAIRFAGKGAAKFEGVDVEPGVHGEPLLVDALATLECAVTEETTGGTHLVFLAAVERASSKPGSPLAYFRGKFGRFTPTEDAEAYRTLREQAIDRKIAPGVPLDLDELSEQTGIERSTVYHGLSQLANDGLVERLPDGRFQVVAVTPQLMEDGLHARGVIELGVAVQRAGNISERELASCEVLLQAMEAAEDGSLDHWVEALETFLNFYVSLAASPTLLDSYKRLNITNMISNARYAQSSPEGPPKNSAAVHRRLLKAIRENDAEAAADAIHRRTEGTIRALRGSIERAGGRI